MVGSAAPEGVMRGVAFGGGRSAGEGRPSLGQWFDFRLDPIE